MSEIVGKIYPLPGLIEISREQIEDFAAATGDPDPLYRDAAFARSRGHRDVPAPLTYLARMLPQVMKPVLDEVRADIVPTIVVHRDQSFEFAQAVYAGDRLRAVVSVSRFTVVMNTRLMTVQCDFMAEADGGEVCRMITGLVGIDSWGTGAGRDG